ncbi:MAG: urea ABC transporter permease subunit UrtB [Verrucomicrobiae bacterium]|nr:urea ABC transporter permease subunit UrtB [Verrucomicrobiae bacterium]
MRTVLLAALVVLLVLKPFPSFAEEGAVEVREQLADAVTAPEEQQIAILAALADSGDEFVAVALTAWRRGEMFLIDHDGAPVPVLLENADSKEPVRGFLLRTGEVMADASGKVLTFVPKEQKAADTSSALRKQIKKTIDLLAISDSDPENRASGVLKLGLMQRPEYFEVLKQRLAIEKDPDVLKKLKEGIAVSALALGEPDEVVASVKTLGELRSIAGLDSLNNIIKTQEELPAAEQNAPLLKEATRSVKVIDDYLAWVDRAGTAFRGVSLGSVLLIVSLGLAITFGLMGVINMAHGEMIAIGGYSAYMMEKWMTAMFGDGALQWYFLVAIPFSFLMAALAGLVLERSVIRLLYRRPLESLLATWGVSLILEQLFRLYFGAANVQVNSPDWLQGSLVISDVSLGYNRMFVILFAVLIVLATVLLMAKTPLGLCIRAVMQNRDMAACVGIQTSKIRMMTFAFGSGLAGLAGCFLSQIGNVGPTMGQNYIVDSFMVVVAGGVGNLFGTVLAAMGIGMTDQMLQPVLGPVMGKVCVLIAIIIFLQWRPGGLFAARSRSLD